MVDVGRVAEVRELYAEERALRVRSDGPAQYRYFEASDDPWSELVERTPLQDEVDVAIVGAGLSGLMCAVALRKAGVERIRLIDRAGDVGGTWYWNRYPAAQCDVESYIYMPALEEVGSVPTQKYAYQPEILSHCQLLAKKFDLYTDACFHTDVAEMAWDDEQNLWSIETDRGDHFRSRFLVLAGGLIQRPKLPGIPGLDDFGGRIFHSSRWDYEYTGGHPGRDGGGLTNLRDKKVGLVGTGASGLQIVTPVAEAAQQLYVFQRTPVVVLPRNNRPTDPEWARTLQPGWQRERMELFTRRGNSILDAPDVIGDGWTEVIFPVMASHGAGLFGGEAERKQAEFVDLAAMDEVRRRVSELVEDPDTAAKLMPYFRMLCKRPSFHDEYLQAFNRKNVTLVDTRGAGPERITPSGIVAGGTEYKVDCLILATGFDASRGLLKSWGVDLVGSGGQRLTDYWEKGMRTFHGIHVRNFPNCFFSSATQIAGPPNYTSAAVELGEHIAYVISEAMKRGRRRVETSANSEEEWVRTINDAVPDTHIEFFQNCTPGYYNNDGDLASVQRLGANNYMGGAVLFFDILRGWRSGGELEGLELS